MFSVEKFSVLLHQLEQLDRGPADNYSSSRTHAEGILHSFLRFAEFERGAIWLADDGAIELGAAAGGWTPIEVPGVEIPSVMVHRSGDA
ncbi:MAG: hypothetical protein R3338_05255, partial [Thermoanaerobaculia bacterium]|nr:hypothetical protein [Thermoanaerobaculia bacterium]